MNRHFLFKIQIVSVVFVTLIILTTIGVFTYLRLTYIVTNISEAAKPDTKLAFLKQFQIELSDAESTVKSYILTRNTNYLTSFFNSDSLMGVRMDTLQRIFNEGINERKLAGSMKQLVIKKYTILNELLTLDNDEQIIN